MVTVTQNLIDISLADTTTGWSGTSGQLDTEVYKQAATPGTDGAYTYQTGKNSVETCTFTPATNINMTANYTTPHLYWTMRCDVFPFCELLNTGATNSGLMIRVTDGSGNYTQWHVAGRDTWDGGWRTFVLDLTNTANVHSTSGTLSLADVDIISFITDNSNSGNIRIIDNTWVDAVRYGDGLQAESATTETFDFQDIADDDGLTANYYGVLTDVDGVLFCQGGIILGDATTSATTDFVSVSETVYFKDRIVDSAHYNITGVASATATTDIDITGLVCKTVGNTAAEIDFSDTDLNSVSIDTSTFIDMGTISLESATLSDSSFSSCSAFTLSNTTVTGTTFATSGLITMTGTSTMDECTINSTTASSAVSHADLADFTDCTFVSDGSSHAVNLGTVSSTTSMTWANFLSGYEAYNASGTSTGNEAILVNVASGQTLTINVTTGYDTPSFYNTGTGTVTVVSSVTVTVTVKDVAGDVIQDAQVGIFATDDGEEILNTTTNASGIATTGYGGTKPREVKVWIRKASSADSPRYKNYSSVQTISTTGLTLAVTMVEDPNNNATS